MKFKLFNYTIHIYRPMTFNERMKRYTDKRLSKGLCVTCGTPTELKKNGKHYRKCKKHRERENYLRRIKRNPLPFADSDV